MRFAPFLQFLSLHRSNFPSSIRRDSNPRPCDLESTALTTRPGCSPYVMNFFVLFCSDLKATILDCTVIVLPSFILNLGSELTIGNANIFATFKLKVCPLQRDSGNIFYFKGFGVYPSICSVYNSVTKIWDDFINTNLIWVWWFSGLCNLQCRGHGFEIRLHY